jgi:CelD/BcsL family acetyltransferase involved in cellulose biosynthesis
MVMRAVAFDALTASELDAWHAIRAANPGLDSPYFHPDFARVVHETGNPVTVLVGQGADGQITSLLAGHRDGATLRPVGWPGADFQGPIAAPATPLRPEELLIAGIRSFEFDHLLEPGPAFDPWIDSREASPYVDTTGGLDGYLGRASKSGKDNMGQARRRAAKAEREHGPVRFAADVVDPEALRRVIELKRAQYAATGVRDYFDVPERQVLLHKLLHTREPAFAGVLSTLHIGPNLVAAHFGIRSEQVLHWWFPVYDPDFAALAPGWILLRELVTAAPQLGIARIDLGRGDDEYKRRAKTGETTVCRGMVSRSSMAMVLRRTRRSVVSAAKASPLAPGLRQVVRTLRRSRGHQPTAPVMHESVSTELD